MFHTNEVHSSDDQVTVYINYKFHDPWGRSSCARVWPYKLYSENALFFLKSSSLHSGMIQTNQLQVNDDQGRVYVNCKFHDPGPGVLVLGCGNWNHIVKMLISYWLIDWLEFYTVSAIFLKKKIFFFRPNHRSDKLSILKMMANEECTEIGSFTTPGAGGLVLGCGHKSHLVKMYYFFQNHLFFFGRWFRQTHKDSFDDMSIDSYCINRSYCNFPLPLLIFIYSMMGLMICKYELTRSQCLWYSGDRSGHWASCWIWFEIIAIPNPLKIDILNFTSAN